MNSALLSSTRRLLSGFRDDCVDCRPDESPFNMELIARLVWCLLLACSALARAQDETSSTSADPDKNPDLEASRSEPGFTADGTTGANALDVESASSGSDKSAFSLSRGGMIAIIVVVVVVVVIGGKSSFCTRRRQRSASHASIAVLSIVLFVVAKRRQWKVRESIKRASRRLTGRAVPKRQVNRQKRSGIVTGPRNPRSAPIATKQAGVDHKGRRNPKITEIRDVEKG